MPDNKIKNVNNDFSALSDSLQSVNQKFESLNSTVDRLEKKIKNSKLNNQLEDDLLENLPKAILAGLGGMAGAEVGMPLVGSLLGTSLYYILADLIKNPPKQSVYQSNTGNGFLNEFFTTSSSNPSHGKIYTNDQIQNINSSLVTTPMSYMQDLSKLIGDPDSGFKEFDVAGKKIKSRIVSFQQIFDEKLKNFGDKIYESMSPEAKKKIIEQGNLAISNGEHIYDDTFNKKQEKKKQQTQKPRKQKIRKPPKSKTSPDEDFGDENLNKVYNTTKSALELNNAKFDKSKLLIESINFENAYLEAFHKEIDFKKEIGTLQDEMNKLQGEDLETMNKKLGLQTEINMLKSTEVNKFLTDEANKIENLDLRGSLLQVDELLNALDGIQKLLDKGGLDIATENSLLRSKKGYESLLASKTERKPIDLIPIDPNKKGVKSTKDLEKYNKFIKTVASKENINLLKLADGAVQAFGSSIGGFFTALAKGDSGAFRQFMKSIVTTFLTSVQAMILGSKAAAAAKSIGTFGLSLITDAPLLAAAWVALEAAKGFIQGLNKGGMVQGYGDSDSVPVMLTPGEFVIRKNVVNQLGTDFLHRLNGGNSVASTSSLYNKSQQKIITTEKTYVMVPDTISIYRQGKTGFNKSLNRRLL